jgi:hypothetical protein
MTLAATHYRAAGDNSADSLGCPRLPLIVMLCTAFDSSRETCNYPAVIDPPFSQG